MTFFGFLDSPKTCKSSRSAPFTIIIVCKGVCTERSNCGFSPPALESETTPPCVPQSIVANTPIYSVMPIWYHPWPCTTTHCTIPHRIDHFPHPIRTSLSPAVRGASYPRSTRPLHPKTPRPTASGFAVRCHHELLSISRQTDWIRSFRRLASSRFRAVRSSRSALKHRLTSCFALLQPPVIL